MRKSLIPIGLAAVSQVTAASPAFSEPIVIGWLENIHFAAVKMPIKAKIDTGAKTSSLGVLESKVIQRDGVEWVRFAIRAGSDETVTLERKLTRRTTIRRANTPISERLVVTLRTCLGGYQKDAEFTLSKRTGMNYSVLIGRRFLADKFVVAASEKYLTKPECPGLRN